MIATEAVLSILRVFKCLSVSLFVDRFCQGHNHAKLNRCDQVQNDGRVQRLVWFEQEG